MCEISIRKFTNFSIAEDFQVESTHFDPPPSGETVKKDPKSKKEVKSKKRKLPVSSEPTPKRKKTALPKKVSTPKKTTSPSTSIVSRILKTPDPLKKTLPSPVRALSKENPNSLFLSGSAEESETPDNENENESEEEEDFSQNKGEEEVQEDSLIGD